MKKKSNNVMEFEPKDQKVVDLLAKLKNANGGYPQEMLASRRQTYLNQIAGMGLGAGIGTVLKNVSKNGGGAGFTPPSAGALLEVVLVVAIVAEAGVLTYFNRDKVADFFQSFSTDSNGQEVVSPPVIPSQFPELEISGTPLSVYSTGTASEVPTGTPVPGITGDLTVTNNEGANLASATPNPSVNNENNGNNGNNGHHYGQTPKPERTKENNKDKPPKDNPGNGNKDKTPQGNGNK
jgi:hypothetical protein